MFGFHYGPPTNILQLEHITMFEQTRQPASVEREREEKKRKGKGGGRIRGVEFAVFMDRSMAAVLGISSSSSLRPLHEKREASLVFFC